MPGQVLGLAAGLDRFGAEKSFEPASRRLKEHYGVELHRSSIREVVLKHAERAAGLVDREDRETIASYERQRRCRPGPPWLIVQTDGSMVRTGELARDPAGGVSPGGRPKRIRKTQWREVRLSLVEAPGGLERRYAAAIGPPQRTGAQLFALALSCAYGDNTWMHGVGDGAPWIARQSLPRTGYGVAAVFPRPRFLLDRYHLLEHWHGGASALMPGDAASAQAWVRTQVSRIDQGDVAEVVAECRSWAGPRTEQPLRQLAGYLENRPGQLDYAAARQQGLPIGSGAVERGNSEPPAGLEVIAGQRPLGSLLELIPTAFSHTRHRR